MSEEALIKAEKDYTDLLDTELPEIEKISDVPVALERLLALEKKVRQASDLKSSRRVLTAIVDLTSGHKDWALMNEQVQLLSKKHGQLKQAITTMIQQVLTKLDDIKDDKLLLESIESIRNVTEGKIFVEVERARVTRRLAHIREKEGNVIEAADLLGELQVETYGSMDMREKTEFILEQIDLYITKGDYTQARIASKRIVPRYFDDESVEDLKLKYYELLIQISLYFDEYLEICQFYQKLFVSKSIESDESKWKPILQRIVYYIVLAPYDNLQNDLIHKISLQKKLASLPFEKELIKCFTAQELMRWPKIEEIYSKTLRATDVFTPDTEKGAKHWLDLRNRVIEHNIRVISKYYTRITSSRLTNLLDLDDKETERYLSELVNSKTVYARINRPQQVITFQKPKKENDVLSEWLGNIDSLLNHLEAIDHLIAKDEMIYGLKA